MSIELDKPFNNQCIESTTNLKLDFLKLLSDNHNVIPVAVQNAITQEVILIAYTNEPAFKETIKQKKLYFGLLQEMKCGIKVKNLEIYLRYNPYM